MDDMFPYLTNENDSRDPEYWTGFFTSRPAFKYMVREGSNLLQVCNNVKIVSIWSLEVWKFPNLNNIEYVILNSFFLPLLIVFKIIG